MNEKLIDKHGNILGEYAWRDAENGLVFTDKEGREFGVNPYKLEYIVDIGELPQTREATHVESVRLFTG